MESILDLDRFPLDQPDSAEYKSLLQRCQDDLASEGMFNLVGFLRRESTFTAVAEIEPIMQTDAFTHKRRHNIYFRKEIPGLPADHPALRLCETVNRTLCADQITGSIVSQIYTYPPLARFLAAAMDKEALFLMDDPLARMNVMAYRAGETLNWHFDRSEFTTTLLLQSPETGGVFEYRQGLRSDNSPNYDGVAALLNGKDPELKHLNPAPGTLNVFRGKNTAHRVTEIQGETERLVAVFSYFERSGVVFSDEERLGFYGRVA